MMMMMTTMIYPEVAAHLAMVRIKRLLNEWELLVAESTLNLNEMRELYPTNSQHSPLSTILNLSSPIDEHTHSITVTLTFDLLTSESMHTEE